jgi:hypothetical protein
MVEESEKIPAHLGHRADPRVGGAKVHPGEKRPMTEHDLNKVHQAAMTLSAKFERNQDGFDWSQRDEFLRQLEIVVIRDSGIQNGRIQFELVNATARQREEALVLALALLVKWKK